MQGLLKHRKLAWLTEDRIDNILVTRATAQVARKCLSDLRFGGIGMIAKKRFKGHDNAGGAKPALQAVAFMQGLLKHRKLAWLTDRLNGAKRMAFHLDGKDQTGASRLAVHPDRASATNPMLAADMGSRELAMLAQDIRQQMAWLNGNVHIASIHRQSDGDRFHAMARWLRSRACCKARVVSVIASCFR